MGGLGLPKIDLEQGLEQLRIFIMHAASETIKGQLIRTSLEQTQLEVVELGSIFYLDSKLY